MVNNIAMEIAMTNRNIIYTWSVFAILVFWSVDSRQIVEIYQSEHQQLRFFSQVFQVSQVSQVSINSMYIYIYI